MKQTNSAIKFLLAQYRAIFKHAQLASVLAIAAAAAASSSAAAAATPFDNDVIKAPDFAETEVNVGGAEDKYASLTLSGGALTDSPDTNEALVFDKTLTINVNGGDKNAFTVKTAGTAGVVNLTNTTMTIAGDDAKNTTLTVGSATDGVDVTLGTLNLKTGTLAVTKGSISAATMNIGNTGEAAVVPTDAETALVTLASGASLGKKGTGDAVTTINLNNGSKVTLVGDDNKTATIAANTINLNGGKIETAAQQKLTIDGTLNASAGKITVAKGTAVAVAGDATFAAGTIANAGTLDIGTDVDANRTWTVDATDFPTNLGTVSGSMAANKSFTLKVAGTTSEKAIDLAPVVDDQSFAFKDTVLNVTGDVVVDADYAKLGTTAFKAAKGTLKSKVLTVGTAGAFEVDGGAKLSVSEQLKVDGTGGAGLSIKSGTVTLAGASGTNGSVDAKAIELNADTANADQSVLDVTSGKWTVKDLTVTKGQVKVGSSASLAVNGKLKTAATGSTVEVDGGTLDLNQADTTIDLNANTVKLTNTGVVEVAAGTVLKKDQDGKYGLNTGFVQNAVSSDSTSTLKLISASGESIKVKDKTALDALVKAIGFDGMISGISLETVPDDGAELKDISANTDAYKDVQVTIDSTAVDKAYTVDSVVLKSGTDVLTIGADSNNHTTGSITFNDPKNGKFVSKADGNVADVKLTASGSTVVLAGSGEVGAITNDAAGNGKVVVGNQADGGTVKVGGIGGANAVASLTVNDKVALTSTGDISAQDFVFNGTKLTATDKTITVGGSGKKVEINGGIETKNLVIAADQANVNIAGEAKVDVDALTLNSASTVVNVGVDGNTGSSATLEVGTLTLNSGSLIVDPDFQHKAAVAAVSKLSKTEPDGKGSDAQVLDGNIAVGMNSAVGIGFETRQDVVDLLQSYGYMTNKEILNQEKGLKAALVVNTPIKVSKDNGIIVDGDKQGAALQAAIKDTNFKNKLDLGKNSALVVNSDTYGVNADGSKKGVAITFEGDATTSTSGTVSAADATSKIILAGDFDASDAGVQIFGNINPITTPAGGITVVSANGILEAKLDNTGKVGKLTIASQDKFDAMFAQASAPVRDLLKDKLTNTDPNKYDRSQLGTKFIGAVANDTDTSGVKADAAAHAATYAGAQQAAVAALGTMADAVGGRVGSMGVEASAITATGSQANGGVWLAPMYKSVDADGFAAQGASYGADIDLGGVAFGVDTVNGDMRFGAVFNIGSGDADGKGNGNGLKDEFDYYGFGMYAAMGFGNFSLVGDASLNVISHDVEGSSGLEKFGMLKASADTTAITMGVTGQYLIETPAVDVVPHMGARFIRLDTDSYDLISEQGAIATTDFEVQNVMSIPVGVTFSKALEMGGWSLAPSADLSVTFNTGDTEVDSTTVFSGVPSLALNTEVLDEVTYGVAVGLGAQYGAFGTNISVSYTGSENTDAFGINAAARYAF